MPLRLRRRGRRAPRDYGSGGPGAEGAEEDDGNALSLSALEEKLKPEVLRNLTKIAKVYVEMSKVQNRRLSTLNRGQKPSPEFEKSYEKHRKKIVDLVRQIHINANRIEQLKLSLYDLNRRLMMLEGRLLRLAVSKRQIQYAAMNSDVELIAASAASASLASLAPVNKRIRFTLAALVASDLRNKQTCKRVRINRVEKARDSEIEIETWRAATKANIHSKYSYITE